MLNVFHLLVDLLMPGSDRDIKKVFFYFCGIAFRAEHQSCLFL
jgi:hypothetical protein